MRKLNILAPLLILGSLAACTKSAPSGESGTPLLFSAAPTRSALASGPAPVGPSASRYTASGHSLNGTAASEQTPGASQYGPASAESPTRSALSSVYGNFIVWGSRTAETTGTIMPGYRVNFDIADGWTYTDGEGTAGQELQYWSYSARDYRFHAGSPATKVSAISETALSLDLEITRNADEIPMFSSPALVRKTDPAFGGTVNLEFNYSCARIEIAFRYVASTDVSLTGISLTPPALIANAGTLDLLYDWNKPAVSVSALRTAASTDAPFPFPDIVITGGSSGPVESGSPWYMIPDPASKGEWTLKLQADGVDKEVHFTLTSPWQPGRSYRYLFEYTDEANLVFVGTSTELFVGIDPVPGGDHNFS